MKASTTSSSTDSSESDSSDTEKPETTTPAVPPSQPSSATSRKDLGEEVLRLDKQLVAMQTRLDATTTALARSRAKNEKDKEAALAIEKRLLNQVHQLELASTKKTGSVRQSEARCKELEQQVLQFQKKSATASSGWEQEKQLYQEKEKSLLQVVADGEAQLKAANDRQTHFDSELAECREAAEAADKASAKKIAALEQESDQLRTGCKQLTDKVDSLMKEVIALRS